MLRFLLLRSGLLPGCATLLFATTLAVNASAQESPAEATSPSFRDYIGRYALNDDLVLVVREEDDRLTLLPSFWRTTQTLEPVGKDAFQSLLHPQIKFNFRRDDGGRLAALVVAGHDEIGGEARRLDPGELLPVEMLLADQPGPALERLAELGGLESPDRAVQLGFKLIRNYPSRAETAALYFDQLERRFPRDVDLQLARGLAWMLVGRRDRAARAFRRAAEADPEDRLAQRALRHLDPQNATPPPEDAWTLPFDLGDLFRAPTREEIAAVRAEWEGRDLSPSGVEWPGNHEFENGAVRFAVRVVSHLVHGYRHYGAILVPERATPGCCPVILALGGVDATYSGISLDRLKVPDILREDAAGFVIVLPSYRGETLRAGDTIYESEGDPSDAWDGATDDAIALLNVALATIPEADGERICAYGKSRGGTVSLLVGIRDDRVDCVVDWAGPSEWFGHMGTFGWTLREQVEWGLWDRWQPGRGWGSASQFIDWFLREPIDTGQPGLAETRHQILASSPLYFLEALPAADLHYGVEDRSVPVANARALAGRLRERGSGAPRFQVTVHEGSGHDMPYPSAHDLTRAFFVAELLGR